MKTIKEKYKKPMIHCIVMRLERFINVSSYLVNLDDNSFETLDENDYTW